MTTTRLNDLFDQMDNEEGNKLDDKIKIEEDKDLEEIFETYKEVINLRTGFSSFISASKTINKINPKKYSSKTITKFSQKVSEYIINFETGMILNHFIQNSNDNTHLIYTNAATEKIDYVGGYNTKNITIVGNIGEYLGYFMNSGKIEVYGNVEENLGFVMKGGVIKVFGEIDSLPVSIVGGEIYHNNKKIVENGKVLDKKYFSK